MAEGSSILVFRCGLHMTVRLLYEGCVSTITLALLRAHSRSSFSFRYASSKIATEWSCNRKSYQLHDRLEVHDSVAAVENRERFTHQRAGGVDDRVLMLRLPCLFTAKMIFIDMIVHCSVMARSIVVSSEKTSSRPNLCCVFRYPAPMWRSTLHAQPPRSGCGAEKTTRCSGRHWRELSCGCESMTAHQSLASMMQLSAMESGQISQDDIIGSMGSVVCRISVRIQ